MLLQHGKQAELGCHVRGPGALEGVVDHLEASWVRGRRGPEVGDGREAQPPARCVRHHGPQRRARPGRPTRRAGLEPALVAERGRGRGGGAAAGGAEMRGGGWGLPLGSARRGVTAAIPGPTWVLYLGTVGPKTLGLGLRQVPRTPGYPPGARQGGSRPTTAGRSAAAAGAPHRVSLSPLHRVRWGLIPLSLCGCPVWLERCHTLSPFSVSLSLSRFMLCCRSARWCTASTAFYSLNIRCVSSLCHVQAYTHAAMHPLP